MRAIDVIDKINDFNISEFPQNALEHTDAKVLYLLQTLRTDWNSVIHPSRHPMGWARFDGKYKGSQHYASGRLSKAGDIFPAGNVIAFWEMCKGYSNIGGLGIYFDTNRNRLQPGPMIHVDIRPERVMWTRINGKYINLNKHTSKSDLILFYSTVLDYIKSL